MANWQLTLVILVSVLVGALVPLLVMAAIALRRASIEIAEVGARLKRTLTQVETISERVEVFSRGFKDGETDIAALLTSVGNVSRGLERNMAIINVISTTIAAVGSAVAAYVSTRASAHESEAPRPGDTGAVPGDGSPRPSPTAS